LVSQEDSVILNKQAIERGLFNATSYKTLVDEEKKQGTYNFETICMPPIEKRKKNINYSFLDERGIVKKYMNNKSVYVEKGDVIIGKTLTKSNKNGEEEVFDCSYVINHGEEGYIDRVVETVTPNGYKMIKVIIRNQKIPEIGDKFASRSAQKGTCGLILPQEDMPFTQDGMCPDILINSLCLTGDTIVTLSNGEVKYIKDIYDKDETIITVSPNDLSISYTNYKDGFQKDGTFMKKITTSSKRVIKCTSEHKFLIIRNNVPTWVETKDLIPYQDKMIIYHSVLPLPDNDGEELFIDGENMKNKVYKKTLEQKGLVGRISREKTLILARLLGYIDTDGHLTIRNEKTYSMRCFFYFGELQDYEELKNDIQKLGFTVSNYTKPEKSFGYKLEVDTSLGYLLYIIGACVGNKNKVKRCFPSFIKNGSSAVKREFLSGFGGGDGGRVSVNWKLEQQQIKIHMIPHRVYIENEEIHNSHVEYMNEIIKLYEFFDIEAKVNTYKTETDAVLDYKIYFSTRHENLNRYVDIIDYRYCNEKRRKSRVPIEYLKSRKSGFWIEYQRFTKYFQYGDLVTTFVEDIEDIPDEKVYDFTTISENHSFIANSIVSSNCIPSRMTISQILETVLGKACCMEGTFGDATPFSSNSTNIAEQICERLKYHGFQRQGWETMYNGMTGEPLEAQIFMGPVFYQRLKHMVSDKMHSRSQGHVTSLTRQPLEGRSRSGGLRFGEIDLVSVVSKILLVRSIAGNIAYNVGELWKNMHVYSI
jgi:hypothetical protein